MLRATILSIGKEFRLLRRDRVGLFMLLIAPVAVIAAAGFSLANIYGAASPRAPYQVAIVDEDHGELSRALREGLARERSIRVVDAASRVEAARMVRDGRHAAVTVVVPKGAGEILKNGGEAQIIIYTDPVRYLQTVRIDLVVSEICRRIIAGATSEARERLAAEQARVRAEIDNAALAIKRVSAEARKERRASEERVRARVQTALADAQTAAERALDDTLGEVKRATDAEVAKRHAELETVKTYLAKLQQTQREFERWIENLKKLAGSASGEIPAPPVFPAPPAELAGLESAPTPLDIDALRSHLAERVKSSKVTIELPPATQIPGASQVGDLKVKAGERSIMLPGSIAIVERDLMDRPVERGGGFNAFNLHVPGFAVTFLLIGMLMGVSMALIDERDWGTLDRLRSAAAPLSATLAGKLIARFLVGFAQLVILFAAGWALFGMSLGATPAALLLPSAAVAFAGASFGLVVAGVARTRDAVLPVGAIVIMTMAAIGGCWWPLDFEPEWMQQAALAVPTTWAMQAYNDLMIRELPASSALWPSAVNAAFGFAYIAIGVALVRRRFGSG
ncbi:MAG: ABC transporter permease [Candidatus Binataceae bacterium]